MLLRAITKHVNEQNWFAVGLDFCIVVIGILLAFQITEWNQARKDVALEKHYLQRIYDEISRDKERMEARLVSWKQVVDSGEGALEFARTGKYYKDNAWDTAVAFYFAGDVSGWRSEQETFEELRNAGRLGLISNDEIRTFLIRYGTGVRETTYLKRMIELDESYYWRIRQETPLIFAKYIVKECISWMKDADNSFLTSCASPFEDAEVDKQLNAYVQNEDLLKDLRAKSVFMAENITIGEKFLKYFPFLLQSISEELGEALPASESPKIETD